MPDGNLGGTVPKGHVQGIITYDPDGSERRGNGTGAIMRGGQEQILLHQVIMVYYYVSR
jgi:hypothetical protein